MKEKLAEAYAEGKFHLEVEVMMWSQWVRLSAVQAEDRTVPVY